MSTDQKTDFFPMNIKIFIVFGFKFILYSLKFVTTYTDSSPETLN